MDRQETVRTLLEMRGWIRGLSSVKGDLATYEEAINEAINLIDRNPKKEPGFLGRTDGIWAKI